MPRWIAVYPSRLLASPAVRIASDAGRHGTGRSEVAIEGLVCALCARRTERALAAVPGVERARVDLAAGRATIEHRGPAPTLRELRAAIDGVVIARGWRRRLESWARLAGSRRGLRRGLRRARGRA